MKIICPVCKNITTWEENPFRPFCSERCRLIDLGAWASEEYRIAGKPREEQDRSDQNEGEE
ncbi:MAG: DNA gyrase inhibitor YacG [Nitrospirota bacterium]|nr:DNA gyrase inhibitor YacG [Nitrospirota bacterium]